MRKYSVFRRTVHAIGSCLAALAVGAVFAPSVSAQAELTVEPSRVEAGAPLVAGRTYELPLYTARNRGGQTLRVTVSPADRETEGRRLPPEEWFTIVPADATVAAGGSQEVQVTVNLPLDAPAGRYRVWFSFTGAVEGSAETVATRAEVLAPLIFDVEAARGGASLAWTIVGVAAVVLAAGIAGVTAARYLGRRSLT